MAKHFRTFGLAIFQSKGMEANYACDYYSSKQVGRCLSLVIILIVNKCLPLWLSYIFHDPSYI